MLNPVLSSHPNFEASKRVEKIGLHYVNDAMPGITRQKAGKGFYYLDESDKKISNQKVLKRIEQLRIPPAWQKVWISTSEHGHIQAIGYDEKNRKQYIYHPDWIRLSQQHKFNKLLDFSEVLPELRKKVKSDMKPNSLSRDSVLATIIWLLDNTYIRVGNDEYAKQNHHFGLTTFRTNHVEVHGYHINFEFTGKSGKIHKVDIKHPKVAKMIRNLEELPGMELFQFVDENNKRHMIHSHDVNEYLKQFSGEDTTAKDFRTWGGTVLSAVTLNKFGEFETKKQAKKNITQAVKTVAKHLRNTPAVSRSYYIHPVVPESYLGKKLVPHFAESKKSYKNKGLSFEEFATRNLLISK